MKNELEKAEVLLKGTRGLAGVSKLFGKLANGKLKSYFVGRACADFGYLQWSASPSPQDYEISPEFPNVYLEKKEAEAMSECWQFLTSLASGGVSVFMVLERLGYDDGERGGFVTGRGHPQPKVYLTRESADAAVALENARSIRWFCPFTLCYDPEDVVTVPIAEFEQSVSGILGKKFKLPDDVGQKYSDPVFPKKLSDEQFLTISNMLRIELHEVKEVKLIG